jgi:WD40 repeat protein
MSVSSNCAYRIGTVKIPNIVGYGFRFESRSLDEAITPPMRGRGHICPAECNREGRYVSTCSHDHTARLWDARTGGLVAPRFFHAWLVLDTRIRNDISLVLQQA